MGLQAHNQMVLWLGSQFPDSVPEEAMTTGGADGFR